MPLVKSDLDRAVRYHQSGKLNEAGEIYERILKSDPGHPDVLQHASRQVDISRLLIDNMPFHSLEAA